MGYRIVNSGTVVIFTEFPKVTFRYRIRAKTIPVHAGDTEAGGSHPALNQSDEDGRSRMSPEDA
jgi:hypothetical protein